METKVDNLKTIRQLALGMESSLRGLESDIFNLNKLIVEGHLVVAELKKLLKEAGYGD